jgi:hypothetical protein
MLVVVIEEPRRWCDPAHAAARLDYSRARWHIACAPNAVRRYTPAVYGIARGSE